MSASTLNVSCSGFTDVTGHTEYIIKTSVGEHQYSVQHRFSSFLELHDMLLSKLPKLPGAFPVAKSMFSSDTVKRDRVEKLQAYLRNCVRLCGDQPVPLALVKFLKVDPSVLKADGISATASDGVGASGAEPGPVENFNPFGDAFVPERPDDSNEGLREAIKAGNSQLCLELIAAKADPNYRDRQGNTPLHMAALFQRSDVAKALLLAGADLTLKNGAGELPERMASVSLKLKFTTFKETGEI